MKRNYRQPDYILKTGEIIKRALAEIPLKEHVEFLDKIVERLEQRLSEEI